MKEYELHITGFGNDQVDIKFLGPLSKLKELIGDVDVTKPNNDTNLETVPSITITKKNTSSPIRLIAPVDILQLQEKIPHAHIELAEWYASGRDVWNHIFTKDEIQKIADRMKLHFHYQDGDVLTPISPTISTLC